jgi:tRNA threonylcarbamoyladenosine biosynthesis protein TsaB
MPEMKLLAVDTTSLSGSVALLEGDELRGLVGFSAAPGHAERLLPTIDSLLEETSIPLAEVEAFAVAAGPGSFTGLRIGISTVEGLAYTTRRPLVGVNALDATAHRFRYRVGLVAAFVDARRGEVFGALYRSDGDRLESVIEPVCEAPERLLKRFPAEPILVAGNGTIVYKDLLSTHTEVGQRLQLADPSFFLAEEVARIGSRLIDEGKNVPLGGLEAIYLRPSDAEKARQKGRES